MNNEFYASTPDQPNSSPRKVNFMKLLVSIVTILVIAEVIWGVYTLTSDRGVATSIKPQTDISVPSTSTQLIPKGELMFDGISQVKVGETFPVDIVVSSNQPTAGADAIIKFDPKYLEVVPVAGKAATVGKLYQEYPVNSFDNKLGLLTISGISDSSQPASSGQGVLATVKFKAKVIGQTPLSFDFQKGLTTESNVTSNDQSSDILENTQELNIDIAK